MKLTAGQHLLMKAFPSGVYAPGMSLDKKGIEEALAVVAREYPDQYAETLNKLQEIGGAVAKASGGASIGIEDLRMAAVAKSRRQALLPKLAAAIKDLPPEKRGDVILQMIRPVMDQDRKEVNEEAKAKHNPLADQLAGAGRGNPAGLARLLGSDWLYDDSQGNQVPIAVYRSYSQGLSPGQYVASTFGARKGVVTAKLSVANGGYLNKQLTQAVHRMVVAKEEDENQDESIGMPVQADDSDNDGALLARSVAGYARNTPITPKIRADLKRRGITDILVRSPIVSSIRGDGVAARDVGLITTGRLPELGTHVGTPAAQALSEKITQSLLSAKHGGGASGTGKNVSSFELTEKTINPSESRLGWAVHADADGHVGQPEPAPQGGFYVSVGKERLYVPPGQTLSVKPGDYVEAGDQLTDGIVNHVEVAKHKHIGEGRRAFIQAFSAAMQAGGFKADRRNVELVARGLINRVRMTGEYGDYLPDDVVPYGEVAASWKPREGAVSRPLSNSVHRYLEKPVLHYTVGTRVTPRMLKEVNKYGVTSLVTHHEPPPFEPEIVRGIDLLQTDPDWQTRMLGGNLERGFLEAAQRGRESDVDSTSFVPGRAQVKPFNRIGPIQLDNPKVNVFKAAAILMSAVAETDEEPDDPFYIDDWE